MLIKILLLLLLAVPCFAQKGERKSDYRINKMYDTTKSHPAHKRRNMTVQLGDSTKSGRLLSGKQFQPSFSFSGWGGEVRFRIHLMTGYDSLKTATRENLTYKGRHRLKLSTSKVIHDIRMEDWGTIWDMVLLSKPDRNVFRYKFQSKGLTFTYQDTLTDEEALTGYRPDSVIGSYAIYHSTRSNNSIQWLASDRDSIVSGEYYGTGKFGHLYRPRAWDSNGDTVWCWINIDTTLGRMRLVIPQAFLNRAVYPVTVDPDVGYTTKGGTEDGQNANRAHGHRATTVYTAEAGKEITSITAWTKLSGAGSETMELAVYREKINGSFFELTTRETSNEQITITNTIDAENSTAALSVAMITDTVYGAAWGEYSVLDASIIMYFDVGSGWRDRQVTSDALGASWNHSSFKDSKFSVYFTYGDAAAGGAKATIMRTVIQ